MHLIFKDVLHVLCIVFVFAYFQVHMKNISIRSKDILRSVVQQMCLSWSNYTENYHYSNCLNLRLKSFLSSLHTLRICGRQSL